MPIQQYLNPEAEYWLDWFPITMRITGMQQMAKGLANEPHAPAETSSPPAEAPAQKSIEQELQSLKWNLRQTKSARSSVIHAVGSATRACKA